MDAWVLVTFPSVRDVYVDSVRFGKTNTAFGVQLGTHTIDLDVPKDYQPPQIVVLVDGTPVTPTVVAFLSI
ncbi:MAG TPA: hypothetical protein VN380_10810 [Thermoanaerobaculia bacterium]|jgi:hypothetical protein|nr:hypothetical protein [Thermoanaerobaculia bacterium]